MGMEVENQATQRIGSDSHLKKQAKSTDLQDLLIGFNKEQRTKIGRPTFLGLEGRLSTAYSLEEKVENQGQVKLQVVKGNAKPGPLGPAGRSSLTQLHRVDSSESFYGFPDSMEEWIVSEFKPLQLETEHPTPESKFGFQGLDIEAPSETDVDELLTKSFSFLDEYPQEEKRSLKTNTLIHEPIPITSTQLRSNHKQILNKVYRGKLTPADIDGEEFVQLKITFEQSISKKEKQVLKAIEAAGLSKDNVVIAWAFKRLTNPKMSNERLLGLLKNGLQLMQDIKEGEFHEVKKRNEIFLEIQWTTLALEGSEGFERGVVREGYGSKFSKQLYKFFNEKVGAPKRWSTHAKGSDAGEKKNGLGMDYTSSRDDSAFQLGNILLVPTYKRNLERLALISITDKLKNGEGLKTSELDGIIKEATSFDELPTGMKEEVKTLISDIKKKFKSHEVYNFFKALQNLKIEGGKYPDPMDIQVELAELLLPEDSLEMIVKFEQYGLETLGQKRLHMKLGKKADIEKRVDPELAGLANPRLNVDADDGSVTKRSKVGVHKRKEHLSELDKSFSFKSLRKALNLGQKETFKLVNQLIDANIIELDSGKNLPKAKDLSSKKLEKLKLNVQSDLTHLPGQLRAKLENILGAEHEKIEALEVYVDDHRNMNGITRDLIKELAIPALTWGTKGRWGDGKTSEKAPYFSGYATSYTFVLQVTRDTLNDRYEKSPEIKTALTSLDSAQNKKDQLKAADKLLQLADELGASGTKLLRNYINARITNKAVSIDTGIEGNEVYLTDFPDSKHTSNV